VRRVVFDIRPGLPSILQVLCNSYSNLTPPILKYSLITDKGKSGVLIIMQGPWRRMNIESIAGASWGRGPPVFLEEVSAGSGL
jgi:hypothetical protein